MLNFIFSIIFICLIIFVIIFKNSIYEYIPSYRYPIIIDSAKEKVYGIRIVANDPDENGSYEYMVLTKVPIIAPGLQSGAFTIMGVSGYSYFWNDVLKAEKSGLIHLKKGISKHFLEDFFEERIKKEQSST